MRRDFLLLFGVLLMWPSRLPAQTPADTPAVSPGTRVRVTVDAGRATRSTGIFVAYRADSIWLQSIGASRPVPVPRSQVLRLEVSRGQRSYWRLGATVGLLLGTAIGALTVRGKTYGLGDNTPTIQVLASMALGGAIGAGVGASIHSDRWQVVPWPTAGAGGH